jgi:hypothetical protein
MIRQQRGSALLVVIVVFATLFALLGLSFERGSTLFIQIKQKHLETTARNLAEAGVEYAIHKIVSSPKEFSGKETLSLDPTGTFSISVARLTPADQIEILATGKAKASGQLSEVASILKVVVQLSQENSNRPMVILSWKEIS